MKVISKVSLALALCAIVASLPASAICSFADNRNFGSYYATWGGFTGPLSGAVGSFWIVGAAGTTHNGTYAAPDWILPSGSDFVPAGQWGATGVAGCPVQNANVQMAWQVSLPSSGGGAVYGGGCAQGTGDFEFGPNAATIAMQEIPKPTVNTSSRVGTTAVDVTLAAPSVPGGILDVATCGLAPQSYRVYSRVVARNGAAPTDRNRGTGGWTLEGTSPIADPITVNVGCDPLNPDGGQDVYLALSVVLNDNQETGLVGVNSTVVQCGAVNADRPSDFKIIKKPIRRPSNQQ